MSEIITADRKMQDLIQLAKTVAQSKATILIQGESGTGKELIAGLVHESSSRSSKPFVAINCAAIPENLLESELFGYERGAFTGAITSKAGKFELANGGTLLLDEISEMDLRLQAKLLRVIQESEIDRLGGKRPVSVDVRIIATTNRNLADCVRKGLFREDLFYRLNVVNLTLPSLRDRLGDISLLANKFKSTYAEKNTKPVLEFSPEALSVLQIYQWPGNVRELENVIERAVLTVEGQIIGAKDIHIEKNGLDSKIHDDQGFNSIKNWTPGRTLNDIEKRVILEALEYHHGNRTHTARALGISIRTLRNKIADFRRQGIEV
jgi:two-component system, response regulator FlrC